ncbi:endonuclease/exonuclease/phosphatase family protein [Babesia divergens]|uniref:Endonuclease/exonuclease/phosphatase family protein n=1 Tax=Babesia divergens TaxID=32595 RepID=A0AAD9GH32_BABDI|nr:endonuclease/exonuclease/phosphatase family protein [Babesia divergens]
MSYFGNNYVLIRSPEGGDKINITINWAGREVNLDRQKTETLKTAITRLKRSLRKTTGRQPKQVEHITDPYLLCDPTCLSWKKSEEGEKCPTPHTMHMSVDSDATVTGQIAQGCTTTLDDEYSILFMTNIFKPFDESETLEVVAENTCFISINDTLLQVYKNIFRILDVSIGQKALIGCPASLNIRSEGPWRYEDITVEWLDENEHVLHRGPIYIPSENMGGRNIKARVRHNQLKWNHAESLFCQVVNIPKNMWQHDRIAAFNSSPVNSTLSPLQSDLRDLRVMSFNILSPTYVATEEAIERFFPYCSAEWLDCTYRNPLILREILMLKPQILCLQECSTGAYHDYMEPVLGQDYNSWLTIKSHASDEGCCMLLQKGMFDILDVQNISFKEEIRKPEYDDALTRIGARNWVNYNADTYFSRYHTIYQMGCFRNTLDSKKNYIFVTNTHLYFHPHGRHIRILQTYVLLNELERFKRRCAEKYGFDILEESSTIICGDFNSFNTEGAFQLMSQGWIPCNHPDFEFGSRFGQEKFNPSDHSDARDRESYPDLDPSNPMSEDRLEVENYQGYEDAYRGRELPFTNYVKTFHGTLDYIFHSTNLKVKRCMPGISEAEAKQFEGLPSQIYPSDHLSIAVDF